MKDVDISSVLGKGPLVRMENKECDLVCTEAEGTTMHHSATAFCAMQGLAICTVYTSYACQVITISSHKQVVSVDGGTK